MLQLDKFPIPTKLKLVREFKGYTQQYVADYVGVSRASINRWETSKSTPPISKFIGLMRCYNISYEEFFELGKRKRFAAKTPLQNQCIDKLLEIKSEFDQMTCYYLISLMVKAQSDENHEEVRKIRDSLFQDSKN